jgi:hypothetical protein
VTGEQWPAGADGSTSYVTVRAPRLFHGRQPRSLGSIPQARCEAYNAYSNVALWNSFLPGDFEVLVVASLDHILVFTYLAYSMTALLEELLPAFEDMD